MKFNESIRLQNRFNEIITGGAHTYAKGDDQFPEFMPPYIVKGKGCRVWDVDVHRVWQWLAKHWDRSCY